MVSMHLAMGMSVTRSSLDDSGSGITCSLRREPCAAAAQARRVCAPASDHLEGHSGWQQLHISEPTGSLPLALSGPRAASREGRLGS
jgi:hypothetical protein